MTYSLNVTGTSKADAGARLASELEAIASTGAIRQADIDAALAAYEAIASTISEPSASQSLEVTISCVLSRQGDGSLFASSTIITIITENN